jgi:hypothetical protein
MPSFGGFLKAFKAMPAGGFIRVVRRKRASPESWCRDFPNGGRLSHLQGFGLRRMTFGSTPSHMRNLIETVFLLAAEA